MDRIIFVSNAETLQKEIKSDRCIVYFYADWCGPCKAIAPTFAKISSEYQSHTFIKANIDDIHHIAEEYEIQSIPTFILFENGKEVNRIIGSDINALKNAIDNKKSKSVV